MCIRDRITGHQVRSYVRPVSDAPSTNHPTGQYEVRFQGHVHPRWAAWFDGLDVTEEGDGTTVLRGEVVDQAALYGLLRKLADLGLPLLSVTPLAPDAHEAPACTTDTEPDPGAAVRPSR